MKKGIIRLNCDDERIIITYVFPLNTNDVNFYTDAMKEFERVCSIRGGYRRQIDKYNMRFENTGSKKINLDKELLLIGVSLNIEDCYIHSHKIYRYTSYKIKQENVINCCIDCYLIAENYDFVASVIKEINPIFYENRRLNLKDKFEKDIKPIFANRSFSLLKERKLSTYKAKHRLINSIPERWKTWRTDIVNLMEKYMDENVITKHALAIEMGIPYRCIYYFYDENLTIGRRFSSFLKIVNFFINNGMLDERFNRVLSDEGVYKEEEKEEK